MASKYIDGMPTSAEPSPDILPPFSKELSELDFPYYYLSIFTQYLTPQPTTLLMRGEYCSPDFNILAPNGTTLFTVQTDSTQILHDTNIHDPRIPRRLFTVKGKGHGDNEEWSYSANEPKKDGKKLLEISTKPTFVLKGGSTRLVFRNGRDDELDALYLQIDRKSSEMKVMYQDKQVGSIQQSSKLRNPGFMLNVPGGMDPVLMVVMALVVDDRLMTQRRRLRRPLHSGWRGIGKGPGAGLAGAYALSGAI